MEDCTRGFFMCFNDWVYNVTNGFWFVAMLMGFQVAIMIASIRLGTNRAFGFAAFVGMIGSIWLAIMGLISWWITTMFIFVGIIGIAIMIMSER